MRNKHRTYSKTVLSITVLSLVLFGTEVAVAAPTATAPTATAPTATETLPLSSFSPNTSTIRPAGSFMKWVCKTIMTTVAVSGYVYYVVQSGGVMMVVAREVIRYVTVPAIVCEWFF
jgi:hypothetical protein